MERLIVFIAIILIVKKAKPLSFRKKLKNLYFINFFSDNSKKFLFLCVYKVLSVKNDLAEHSALQGRSFILVCYQVIRQFTFSHKPFLVSGVLDIRLCSLSFALCEELQVWQYAVIARLYPIYFSAVAVVFNFNFFTFSPIILWLYKHPYR